MYTKAPRTRRHARIRGTNGPTAVRSASYAPAMDATTPSTTARPTIAKDLAALGVRPNLIDYDETRAEFSWDDARRALAGLPGGGVNISYEAVDRHEADGEDVVAARVEARRLDVDGQQPKVGHRRAWPGERGRKVVTDRSGRCPVGPPGPPPVGAEERSDHVTNPSG